MACKNVVQLTQASADRLSLETESSKGTSCSDDLVGLLIGQIDPRQIGQDWHLVLCTMISHTGVWNPQRVLGLLLAALLASPSAVAATMDRPSDGYLYFHRAGADMARHDAVIDACIREVAGTLQPYIARVPTGPLTAMLLAPARAAQQQGADRVAFDSNLENCMVARGWDVVRLNDAEGQRIVGLPQPQQAAMIAPWVGAEQPHGQVVRQYAPIDAQSWKGGLDETPGPPSLSLTAGVHDLTRLNTPPLHPLPAQWRLLQVAEANTVAVPNASVIVIRVTTTAPAESRWAFVRMDAPAAQGAGLPALTYFAVATNPSGKGGSALEKTYVVTVPPGRWRLQSSGATSFCLGGPAFDVGAGEAIFAGTFDAAHPYAPDMTLAPAQSELSNSALAARLKPANWTNGESFPCSALQPATIYVLELPGAPFVDGYAAGTHAK